MRAQPWMQLVKGSSYAPREPRSVAERSEVGCQLAGRNNHAPCQISRTVGLSPPSVECAFNLEGTRRAETNARRLRAHRSAAHPRRRAEEMAAGRELAALAARTPPPAASRPGNYARGRSRAAQQPPRAETRQAGSQACQGRLKAAMPAHGALTVLVPHGKGELRLR